MDDDRDAVPNDVAALREALAVERAKGLEIAAELAVARAKASEEEALIAQQQLQIVKLKHQIYRQRSERSARLIEQLARSRRAGSRRHRGRACGRTSRGEDDDGARIYAQAR
jgi:hypothetical protein